MARDHGFHSVRITRIIQETPDTRTYVLNAPSAFTYRAGQFVTVRACGTLRSYSMSSSPDTDDELMVTVKRVAGGLVSNWMHDHLVPGDLLGVTVPAGVFRRGEPPRPAAGFGRGRRHHAVSLAGKERAAPPAPAGPGAAPHPGRRLGHLRAPPARPGRTIPVPP